MGKTLEDLDEHLDNVENNCWTSVSQFERICIANGKKIQKIDQFKKPLNNYSFPLLCYVQTHTQTYSLCKFSPRLYGEVIILFFQSPWTPVAPSVFESGSTETNANFL